MSVPIDVGGPDVPVPYREPWPATCIRTFAIAFFIATAMTLVIPRTGGYARFWLATYAAVLWFPLGGHYVELIYLNGLRMRWGWIHRRRTVTRIVWWFLGGLPLGVGCWWTFAAFGYEPGFELPFWWGMPFFVLAEVVVHGVLALRGSPNFWNGRG